MSKLFCRLSANTVELCLCADDKVPAGLGWSEKWQLPCSVPDLSLQLEVAIQIDDFRCVHAGTDCHEESCGHFHGHVYSEDCTVGLCLEAPSDYACCVRKGKE